MNQNYDLDCMYASMIVLMITFVFSITLTTNIFADSGDLFFIIDYPVINDHDNHSSTVSIESNRNSVISGIDGIHNDPKQNSAYVFENINNSTSLFINDNTYHILISSIVVSTIAFGIIIAIKNQMPFTIIKQHLSNRILYLFDIVDLQLISFVNKHGLTILRLSLATVFIWFGLLKILGESPVTPLAAELISGIPTETFVFALGIMEIGIGAALVSKILLRIIIGILVVHLASTFSLLIILQKTMINDTNPFLLTLEGEFIIKNLVLIAGALAIASKIRSKKLVKKNR